MIDQDRVPSKEKITCSDGIVNSFFLMCHLGFLWLQFSITYRLMSDRDAQVFDVSSIIFDDANSEHIKAKNYGAFWHGFTICVVMVVSSLLSMGGGSSNLKSKFNRLFKMTPLADTIYMFLLGAKPLGSSFSNMFATLTEKIPITFLNIYMAMHLWTGNYLERDSPTNNSHEIVPMIWISFGLSLMSICISIAEFEAGEAMDFEVADISQFSFYYIFLILYRFNELGSRLILLACVGSTLMTFVLVFDILAMTVGSLGFWAGLILSPWLIAVQFMPFTTIDIWGTRDYLPQHWGLKFLEMIILVSFAGAIHFTKGVAVTENLELQKTIEIMGATQRRMIWIGLGMFFLQYVCLYILLKIGHEYYARSVPSPSEELSSLWRAVKRQCNRMCSCCRRGKKTNRKKHRTKVHASISDIEEGKIPESTRKTLGSTGSSKGEVAEMKLTDYKSDEEIRQAQTTQQQFASLINNEQQVDVDAKPKRRRSKSLKRQGTMML